ncbi:serine threonine protein kinase CMGC group, partial [Spiromyces aspiralis]
HDTNEEQAQQQQHHHHHHHHQQQQERQPKGAAISSSSSSARPAWDDRDGHYIVTPGTNFADRYHIIKLLGQGTFGKVIKCLDYRTNKLVAVKVIRAVQKYRDAAQIEMRVLETLKRHDPTNKFQCIHMNESFDYRNHVCMTFDLLGPSIYDFLKGNEFRPFSLAHVQCIGQQLLNSVACDL